MTDYTNIINSLFDMLTPYALHSEPLCKACLNTLHRHITKKYLQMFNAVHQRTRIDLIHKPVTSKMFECTTIVDDVILLLMSRKEVKEQVVQNLSISSGTIA